MAQYDPQRSHTRHRKADDEGPAPVDAMLGPPPDGVAAGDDADAPVESLVDLEPAAGARAAANPLTWIDPPPGDDIGRGRRPGVAPAVVAGVLVGVLLVVWALLRRRRSD